MALYGAAVAGAPRKPTARFISHEETFRRQRLTAGRKAAAPVRRWLENQVVITAEQRALVERLIADIEAGT